MGQAVSHTMRLGSATTSFLSGLWASSVSCSMSLPPWVPWAPLPGAEAAQPGASARCPALSQHLAVLITWSLVSLNMLAPYLFLTDSMAERRECRPGS